MEGNKNKKRKEIVSERVTTVRVSSVFSFARVYFGQCESTAKFVGGVGVVCVVMMDGNE